MLKPKRLQAGSKVAIVSPSWGGPSRFPDIYELGLKNLETFFGLQVQEFPSARMDAEVLDRNPELRAKDINAAFGDPTIDAIFASIGGDDSVRILPFIDIETVLRHPKILMGFSDTATLLSYFNTLGLVTFSGPSIMAGFAQAASFPREWHDHVREVLFEGAKEIELKPFMQWSEGYPDWRDLLSLGHVSKQQANAGPQWLQGEGEFCGPLWGGCIEVLEFLKGTAYWPADGFWDGKILFFETSEDIPKPLQILYFLRNYGMQGIFGRIAGILFGRAFGYTDEQKFDLRHIVLKVVREEFGATIPIVMECDFGHTDPQWVLPLGVQARMDCTRQSITLLEPAVS